MTIDELLELLNEIQGKRYETRRLELKAAESGCPKRLYDTLSSFSNQDEGGIIVFGVDSYAAHTPSVYSVSSGGVSRTLISNVAANHFFGSV